MVTLVRDEQNVPSFDLALSPMQGERCSPEDWVLCFLGVPLTALNKCLRGLGHVGYRNGMGRDSLAAAARYLCSGLRSLGYCSNLADLAGPAGRERGGNARAALSGKEIGRAFFLSLSPLFCFLYREPKEGKFRSVNCLWDSIRHGHQQDIRRSCCLISVGLLGPLLGPRRLRFQEP